MNYPNHSLDTVIKQLQNDPIVIKKFLSWGVAKR